MTSLETKALSLEETMVKLIAYEDNDEKSEMFISRSAALLSEVVKTMLEEDKEAKEIPLPNVNRKTLTVIIDYLEYHKSNAPAPIEKPLKSSNMQESVCEWDYRFLSNLDLDSTFAIILAANYMDIKSLLELTCASIASKIKGKTPEQIREIFNIENDFAPEEEAAIRAETAWAIE